MLLFHIFGNILTGLHSTENQPPFFLLAVGLLFVFLGVILLVGLLYLLPNCMVVYCLKMSFRVINEPLRLGFLPYQSKRLHVMLILVFYIHSSETKNCLLWGESICSQNYYCTMTTNTKTSVPSSTSVSNCTIIGLDSKF